MRKRRMCACLLLCLALSGCAGNHHSEGETLGTKVPSTTVAESDTQTQPQSMQTRLQYYEELVKQLENELLQVNTQRYVERLDYEARIAKLEETVAAMEQLRTEENKPSLAVPFTYREEADGVVLTSYTGSASSVEVPEQINGKPVVALDDRVFQNCVSLREVIIPKGVERIGWFAFAGCISLERVELPSSVSAISYGAFENCPATLTLRCEGGSYAEAYAKSYGIRTAKA